MAGRTPLVELNDGTAIPQIGLGVFGPDNAGATDVVASAINLGYRLFDTAEQYGNEAGVAEGIRRSGVPREDVYVITKLGNESHGYDATLRGFDGSMQRLGFDYVDLYLIHWPMTKIDKYVESWRALNVLRDEGRIRSVGVANFRIPHLQRLLDESPVVPSVNQIELHPGFQQTDLREFDKHHGIATMAWSPIGGNPFGFGNVLDNPVVQAIGEKYGKSGPQVILRWQLDLGNIVIPKTVTPSRMAENLDIFDFALEPAETDAINALERGIPNPYDPDLDS